MKGLKWWVKMSKERRHEIKLLINQLNKTKSGIESLISKLYKELEGRE